MRHPRDACFLYMRDEICKNGICKNESWRKKYRKRRKQKSPAIK